MAKAISLHVGINIVSPLLEGCVNDAQSMCDLPQLSKFDRREHLFNGEATLDVVKQKISQAAADLDPGGIFVFTFAGHGSYIEDPNDPNETELFDETLVLSDYMLIDDVLARELWPQFAPNTRILMIADSCYSGDVLEFFRKRLERQRNKLFSLHSSRPSLTEMVFSRDRASRTVRTIPEVSRLRHLWTNRKFYDLIYESLPEQSHINASIILLAACSDIETTPDGNPHGVFTQALLDVLQGPTPPVNYDDFINQIRIKVDQGGYPETPSIATAGQSTSAFRAERPFTV